MAAMKRSIGSYSRRPRTEGFVKVKAPRFTKGYDHVDGQYTVWDNVEKTMYKFDKWEERETKFRELYASTVP